MPRKTKAERRSEQHAADTAAIREAVQREGDERRARQQAAWDAHNTQFHGGGECDGSCEA